MRKILLLCCLLSFSLMILAQFKPKDVHQWSENHVIPNNLKVGDEIILNFICKMNDGFHIYAANQPGARSPIKPLIFKLDKSAKGIELVGKVIDGAGNKKTEFDDIFRSDITFYEKTATFSQKIKITAENPVLAAYLDYQICDGEMCIPSSYESNVVLNLGDLDIVPQNIQDAFNSIEFESGKSILKTNSFPNLDKVVVYLKENPYLRLNISGHTDNVGDALKNKELSMLRVKSVRTYLTSNGIDSNRFEIEGYGDTKPIADNKTPEGRQKNRRVEVKIIK